MKYGSAAVVFIPTVPGLQLLENLFDATDADMQTVFDNILLLRQLVPFTLLEV